MFTSEFIGLIGEGRYIKIQCVTCHENNPEKTLEDCRIKAVFHSSQNCTR